MDGTATHANALCEAVRMSNGFNTVFSKQPGVNVSSVNNVFSNNSRKTPNNEAVPLCSVKHVTKCFYCTDLDKKTIENVLARGHKAKALHLHNRGVKIHSRAFVLRPIPIFVGHTSVVSEFNHHTSVNNNCVTKCIKVDPPTKQNPQVSQVDNSLEHNSPKCVKGVDKVV